MDYDFDLVVIGSGPGGMNAALQAARASHKVVMIEREYQLGGSCVHHGTIPSKTLKESAVNLNRCQNITALLDCQLKDNVQVESLMTNKERVRDEHVNHMNELVEQYNVQCSLQH